jgi:uncharacterized delta-60 repeat protein
MRAGSSSVVRATWGGGAMVVTIATLLVTVSAAVAKPQPGNPDRSFGGSGVVHTRVEGYRGAYWTSVAIDRSHRIVVASSNPSGLFARYKPGGDLDTSFSGDGLQRVDFDSVVGPSVALGTGGTVTAAGPTCPGQRGCQLEVARLTEGGKLDPAFGNGGKAIFGGHFLNAKTPVAIDSRGRTTVAGTVCRKGHCDFTVLRLKQNGKLDPSFGNYGQVTTRVEHGGPKYATQLNGMAIDSRGRIIAAGDATSGHVGLVRYTKDGHRDRSFGHHGIVTRSLDHLAGIEGIASTPKDKIVAAGPSKGRGNKWALARFGRKGGLNRSFGHGGETTVNIPCPGNSDPSAVALDSQNRIVVAGRPCYSVARFQPNGKLNRSFGHHGITSKDFGHNFPEALAIDSRDRPVVAGAYPGGIPLTLVRFIG